MPRTFLVILALGTLPLIPGLFASAVVAQVAVAQEATPQETARQEMAAQEGPGQETAPGTAAASAGSSEVKLVNVPFPDLAELEESVAAQLGEMQQILARAIERPQPDRTELAQAFGELGRHYHAYGLVEAAAACYENARRLAPADFQWPYYLAVLQQSRGLHSEAVAAYVNALALGPSSTTALYHLAEIFIEENRLHEARVLLERMLAQSPDSPAAEAALGQIALSEERYADAVGHLERALAKVPQADRLHYPLGLAYRGLGETEKAREHLAQRGSIGVRPADPLIEGLQELKTGERVYLLRGQQAFRAGDFAAATEAFRQAVTAAPESVAARVNLGSALGQLGDREGAAGQYREALRLAPDNRTAHFNLGLLLLTGGGTEEAIEHLEEAADLDPDDPEAHLQLAGALVTAGRIEEALPHYAAAARLSPGDDRPWLGGVNALLRLGRYQEARQRLEEAYSRMPQQGRIVHALARLLAGIPEARLRDGQRALELAQSVYQASPTVAHVETVAMALAELDRCDEAADWQRRALETAEKAGEEEMAAGLRRTLATYEGGEPCRAPVSDG